MEAQNLFSDFLGQEDEYFFKWLDTLRVSTSEPTAQQVSILSSVKYSNLTNSKHFHQNSLENNEQYFEAAITPQGRLSCYPFEEVVPSPYLGQQCLPSPPANTPPFSTNERATHQSSTPVEQPVEQLAKRGPGRPRKHPIKDPNAPKRSAGRPKGQGDTYKRLAKGEKAALTKEERKREVERRKLERIAKSTQPATHFNPPYPSPLSESSPSFWRGTSSGCGLPS